MNTEMLIIKGLSLCLWEEQTYFWPVAIFTPEKNLAWLL